MPMNKMWKMQSVVNNMNRSL